MAERKVTLKLRTQELITLAKTVESQKDTWMIEESSTGFFSRWSKNRSYTQEFNRLKKEVLNLEDEVEFFVLEMQMTANPIVYFLKLCLGFIYAATSILLWFHM